jgi:hypothetical protein
MALARDLGRRLLWLLRVVLGRGPERGWARVESTFELVVWLGFLAGAVFFAVSLVALLLLLGRMALG